MGIGSNARNVRYSSEFKRQVVEDLEKGRFGSILAASRHYGIAGTTTVRSWLKKHGRNHLIPKVVRVEKPDERDDIRRLKAQVRELQEALGQTQLENVLNRSFLRQACEELGLEVEVFKKKAVVERSRKAAKKRERR